LQGFLKVDFVAPNDPYTAFDYVELSEIPLFVPEPASIVGLLFGLTILAIGTRRNRSRK
jgi:hypothetical protein